MNADEAHQSDLKKLLKPTEVMIEAFHKAWPYSSVIGADTIHEICNAMISKSETIPKLLAIVESAGWAKTSLEFCKGIDEDSEIARKAHLEDLADLLEDLGE